MCQPSLVVLSHKYKSIQHTCPGAVCPTEPTFWNPETYLQREFVVQLALADQLEVVLLYFEDAVNILIVYDPDRVVVHEAYN